MFVALVFSSFINTFLFYGLSLDLLVKYNIIMLIKSLL
jgi:hypothetical protein